VVQLTAPRGPSFQPNAWKRKAPPPGSGDRPPAGNVSRAFDCVASLEEVSLVTPRPTVLTRPESKLLQEWFFFFLLLSSESFSPPLSARICPPAYFSAPSACGFCETPAKNTDRPLWGSQMAKFFPWFPLIALNYLGPKSWFWPPLLALVFLLNHRTLARACFPENFSECRWRSPFCLNSPPRFFGTSERAGHATDAPYATRNPTRTHTSQPTRPVCFPSHAARIAQTTPKQPGFIPAFFFFYYTEKSSFFLCEQVKGLFFFFCSSGTSPRLFDGVPPPPEK